MKTMFPIPLLSTMLLLWGQVSVGQTIPVIQTPYLQQRYDAGADTTYVVNFWATWCGPCVKELPYFLSLDSARADDRLTVLLVSLDFIEHLDSKLIPFVSKRQVSSEVFLLDETDPNSWIPRISEQWSGAIPATLVVNRRLGIYHFHEGSFEKGELEELLASLRL